MITNAAGNKVSPKEKAKEIVRDVLTHIENTDTFTTYTSKNTDKEKAKIKEQLDKLIERTSKLTKPAPIK